MEPFELDPMAVIQAQAQKIAQLVNENVQLTAAVAQLQQMLASEADDTTASITDITDEMVGAEVTT